MQEKTRYQSLPPTEENIIKVESLRYNVYGITIPKDELQKTYYVQELRKKC